MKASVACVGLLFFLGSLALAQGYEQIPEDALIVRLGEPGSAYEALELGTRGGRYLTALMLATNTWNPIVAKDGGSVFCTREMQKGLVGIHPMTGTHYPELAKSWEISEDGLAITFQLRKGIRWSDGTPFTADDVVFTYNDLVLNDDVDTYTRDDLRLPDGTFPVVERVGTHSVRFTLSVRFRPLLDALTASIAPEHALAELVNKRNPRASIGTFNAAWGLGTPAEELVGLGPFVLAEFRPDEYARLKRNPYYYHYDSSGVQLPYVDELWIEFVATEDLALLKFLNGELHSIEGQPSDVGVLYAEAATRGYTVRIGDAGHRTDFVMFNFDIEDPNLRKLFRNLSFRKAIAHSQDMEGSLSRLLGLGTIQWSPFSIASPYYAGREVYGGPITDSDAVLYEYDLGKAANLLDECAIVDRNGDGIREFEDGSPVKIEFVSLTGLEKAQQSMLAMKEDLATIGIDLVLNFLSFQSLIGVFFSGQWQAMGFGIGGGGLDPHGWAGVLGSSGMWHRSAALGDILPHEQEIDRLFNQAAGIYDPDEAFEIYKRIQLIFAQEDLGMILGVNSRRLIAVYDVIGNGGAIRAKATPYGSVFDIVFFRD